MKVNAELKEVVTLTYAGSKACDVVGADSVTSSLTSTAYHKRGISKFFYRKNSEIPHFFRNDIKRRLARGLKAYAVAIWLVFLAVAVPSDVRACGINWTLPKAHFEGVDNQGHVLYNDKIGELDLGQGLTIPIFIEFKSNWTTNSPYLGQGWMLPILESRIMPLDEYRFQWVQPDGWTRVFGRSTLTNKVFKGQSGWEAEINGETVTAWASCGWKMEFQKKHLVAMVTPMNHRLDLVYLDGVDSGQVDEVRENGVSVLRVERDAVTGRVQGLVLQDGKRIMIEQSQRPRVQYLNAENVVKGTDYSLSKVTMANGTVKTYGYGVDEQLRPTLKIGARQIVWDPATSFIVKDGEWTYDIKPDPVETIKYAAIGRKNAQGQTELWHNDLVHGQETVQGTNGVQKVKTWFTSGPISGKTKSVVAARDGRIIDRQEYSYDEKGRLSSQFDPDGVTSIFKYDDKGQLSEVWCNGKLFARYTYDKQGHSSMQIIKEN